MSNEPLPADSVGAVIARALLARRKDLGYSVSCTTRAPRAGEVDGRDYYFLSRRAFIDRQERGEFAESAEVHGNLYGTLQAEVDRVLAGGRHVIMDIDVQGALQFRRAFPESVTVFVLPPSGEVLLERLRERDTETGGQLVARLHSALQELQAVDEYQYVVVNDDLDTAVDLVSSIIDAEVASRDRVANLRHQVTQLIERLEREIENHTS
ncbi:MAG: guanylate kinase [Gemmatimonadetes bacterium 21-71-4]|nr:MAG: guanylate kinase [Gemmatimonadetes bacterium 21-71-4]